jgi:RecA-family ATPase
MTRCVEDGEEHDKNLRKLTVMKSNYGSTGDEILMRWEDGFFTAEAEESGLDKVAMDAKADRVFMRLLDDCDDQGRDLFPKNIHTVFARMPTREGLTKSQFARAFERLMANGVIRLQEDGPPSKRRKLVQRAKL